MLKILSYDSKPARFLSRLWSLLVLNILWIIGSLPIVTIGVSTIAAYSVTLKMVEDRELGVLVSFFRAYKENFIQGLILSVLLLFFGAAVVLDFILFEIVEDNPLFLLILGILSAVLILVHFFYVFPLVARYRNSLYRQLTNSRRIFVRFFIRTLGCLVMVAVETWLFLFNGLTMMYVGFFIAPILIISTISAFAIKIFREIESEGGAENIGLDDDSITLKDMGENKALSNDKSKEKPGDPS